QHPKCLARGLFRHTHAPDQLCVSDPELRCFAFKGFGGGHTHGLFFSFQCIKPTVFSVLRRSVRVQRSFSGEPPTAEATADLLISISQALTLLHFGLMRRSSIAIAPAGLPRSNSACASRKSSIGSKSSRPSDSFRSLISVKSISSSQDSSAS